MAEIVFLHRRNFYYSHCSNCNLCDKIKMLALRWIDSLFELTFDAFAFVVVVVALGRANWKSQHLYLLFYLNQTNWVNLLR